MDIRLCHVMNRYHIHYYGLLADRRGLSQEVIPHPADTPAALYEELRILHSLEISSDSLRAAVNDEMVPWQHALQDGDRIAFLPPMSGG
jgi:sulfur-carrier protein